MIQPREQIPLPVTSIQVETLIKIILELESKKDKVALETITTLAESFLTN